MDLVDGGSFRRVLLAGGQCSDELGSGATHLFDQGEGPAIIVFVGMGDPPPFHCLCAAFLTGGGHSHSSSSVCICCCPFMFVILIVCWSHHHGQERGVCVGGVSSVMGGQGAGELVGRGLLTGVLPLPLSSWVLGSASTSPLQFWWVHISAVLPGVLCVHGGCQ